MPLASPQTNVTTSDEPSTNDDSSSVPAAVEETVLQTEHQKEDIPPAVTSSEAQPTDVAMSPKASPSLSAEWPSLTSSLSTLSRILLKRCLSLMPVRLTAKKVRHGSSSESDGESPTPSRSSYLSLDPEQIKALLDIEPPTSLIDKDDFLSFLKEIKYSKKFSKYSKGLVAMKY